MHTGALRTLEFDQIVAMVAGQAVTSTGRRLLDALAPSTDVAEVKRALETTSEGVRFVADHSGFPLRAPSDLDSIIEALDIESRPLEALRLLGLADYLDTIGHTRAAIEKVGSSFPRLSAVAARSASFKHENADVRRAITPSGEVADDASAKLASIRERLRRQRGRLRTTLESFLRGRDTAKYLQEQVITDRNGRYVLVVRAEHRSSIPGIVHGASASGASLFLEPLQTVEINNDIVALEQEEADEVHRILVALTDAFRERSEDLEATLDAASDLDAIQAKARFAAALDGIEPAISADGSFELRGARHPLLIPRIRDLASDTGDDSQSPNAGSRSTAGPVPVDIQLVPPVHVLVIAGPNTGGKTVALKTAGLLAAMAQSGLHIPVDPGSRLPIFKSIFADIGDEQSISASLSTFSAHITNVVAMSRNIQLPALVLLDEVGAGTDPVEGGALGAAIIDHFRRARAHLIATTHYDALKSYASTTEGVAGAAFGFNPETFAPTYRLVYGSQGRSLAIEIAARLGMPAPVIAAARANLTEPEKQLAEHLARLDEDLKRVEEERRTVQRERSKIVETEQRIRAREESVEAREERIRKRLDAKLDEQLRDARREIETVIEGLKSKAAALSDRASVRLNVGGHVRPAGLSTGELGETRAEARAALERIAERLKGEESSGTAVDEIDEPTDAIVAPGVRVLVGPLGLEGVVSEIRDDQAEVDVRGKRLRAPVRELRVVGGSVRRVGSGTTGSAVHVRVDLQPRDGLLSEVNVIGLTVDQALDKLDKFLDQATVGDIGELRIVHGHGTGQLRRAVARYLRDHPLVERFDAAPDNQGGGGVTVVLLKD